MKKKVIMLMVAITLAKIGGFIKDIVLSYYYGASISTDAYIISLTIPNFILDLVSVGITTGFIPMYSSIEKEAGAKAGIRFTNYIINLILILCTLLFAVALMFTGPIVRLFASGFDAKNFELAVMLTRISVISIYFIGAAYVFHSFLSVKSIFFIPGLIGLPANLVTILFIMLSVKTNMAVLAVGSIAASILEITVVFLLAGKAGFKYTPELDFKDKNLKRMAALIFPAIIGSSANEINKIVDKTLASNLAEGGISALNYALKVDSFISGMLIKSISSVVFPNASRKAANNDMDGLKKTVLEAMSLISLIVIPATIGAMIFSQPIVELLFSRGAFDNKAAIMTSNAFLFYSLGMLGTGNRAILVKIFYSLHDTKTPVINSFVGMISNLVLNLVLSKFLGVGGLALASSISAFISMSLMMITLRKKIGSLGLKKYLITVIKISIISFAMGFIAKLLFNKLAVSTSQNLSLFASVLAGAAIFLTAAYYAKIDIVDRIVGELKKRLRGSLLFGYSYSKPAASAASPDTLNFNYYHTDFREHGIGTLPFDWTIRWAQEAEYCILEGEIPGRQLLRVDTCSNVFNNKIITWNTPGCVADVKVRARVRNREVNEYQAWLAVRADGTTTEPTGYLLAMGIGKFEIISFLNGSYQFHTEWLMEWKAGVWYWVDLEVIGNSIKAKAWEAGTDEPDHNQLSVIDSRIQSSGWIGFGGMAPGYHDCDTFEIWIR